MKCFLFLLLCGATRAAIPDAEIYVDGNHSELGRFANFGSRAAATGALYLPPQDNSWLCNTSLSRDSAQLYAADAVLLTPRGGCSFELKAINAQNYGASGVFIYNNLQSRYGWNDTSSRVGYPVDELDYECANGQYEISNFPLDPPKYQTSIHDNLLTLSSKTNLCHIDEVKCTSGRCLATGPAQSNLTTFCCAWDMFTAMHSDSSLEDVHAPTVFSIFLTMAQAEFFLHLPEGTKVIVSQRAYPKFNASSFLLWMMATTIVALASWLSAGDYRRAKYKLSHPVPAPRPVPVVAQNLPFEVMTINVEDRSEETRAESEVDDENQLEMTEQQSPENPQSASVDSPHEEIVPPPLSPVRETAPIPASTSALSLSTRQPPPRIRGGQLRGVGAVSNPNGSVELNIWHAALFVVIASSLLLLLFFFQFYTAVTVLYAVGCAGAVSQILFRPLYSVLATLLNQEPCVKSSTCPKLTVWGFNQVVWLDLISAASGYTLGGIWLFVWFTNVDPLSVPFYWITQNIMGACLCILFLSLLKINSFKVASVLLFVAFVYDIFFVLITPLFLQSSMMLTVAGGGSGSKAPADYCEKYPNDADCRSTTLPMLLTIPSINDYRGGSSVLGLGDIVLPGLLLSFAARLDEAKRLIGGHTTLNVKTPFPGGYLLPLTMAYAVGLLFGDLAVVWLDSGQPALLYLVPTCLGTLVIFGWQELDDLWKGPKVIRWADNLVRYCDRHTFVAHPSDDATVVDTESVIGEDDVPSVRSIN